MACVSLGPLAKQYVDFSPRMISGCQLWLDANDSNTFTLSGSSITTWADKSGNGRNAVGYTGTGTYSSNGLNSLPTVQITRTGNMSCTIAANTFSNTVSCFIVFQCTATSDVNPDGLITRSIGTTPIPAPFDLDCTSINTQIARRRIGGNSTTTNHTAVDVFDRLFRRKTPTIYYFNIASNALTTWNESINGVFATYTTTVTAGVAAYSDAGTALYIGGTNVAGSGRFIGNISEIIMYNTVLLDTQRQQVEGYLAWKWKLMNFASQFSPLTISPFCQVWLDAADTTTVTTVSDRVSYWADKSPNRFDVSQTTAANRPVYTSGQYVTFSNSNVLNWVNTNNILNGVLSNYAIFMVFNPISASNVFLDKTQGGNRFNTLSSGIWQGPTTGGVFISTSGFAPSNALVWTNNVSNLASSPPVWTTQSYTQNTPQIACLSVSTVGANISFATWTSNGYTLGSNGTSLVQTLCNNGNGIVSIGPQLTSGLASNTNFNLHELIIYSSALNDSQRQAVEGYLAWKWNLQSSLAPSNDYYSNAPTYAIVPASNSYYQNTMNPNQFDPLTFPGCTLWLDCADPSTLTVNITSNISRWRDKSPQQNDLIQNTAGNQPTYILDSTVGRNGVFFGSQRFLSQSNTSTKFAINTNRFWSTFVVARWISTSGTQNIYRKQFGVPAGDQWIRLSAGNISFFIGNQESQLSFAPYGTNPVILTHVPGGQGPTLSTSTSSYIQGAQVASSGTVPVAINNWGFSLGGNANSESMNGYIFEMIIYNNPLTNTQRQVVEGYLAWKWGLVGFLNANHPYKTIAPLNLNAVSLQRPLVSPTIVSLGPFDRPTSTAMSVYNRFGTFLSRTPTAIPYARVTANSNSLIVGAGNYYTTYTASNADDTAFATTLASLGGADVFVIRYYSNGAVSWVTRIGSTNNEVVTALAPINTNLGDEILVGGYAGGLSGGATSIGFYTQPGTTATLSRTLGPAATDYMAWVTRYTSAGTVNLAIRMIGSASSGTLNTVRSIVVDTVDNSFYVIGTFTSLTFNIYNAADTLGGSLANDDADVTITYMFIAKYTSAGVLSWITKAKLNTWTEIVGAVIDNSRNLVVALNAQNVFYYSQPGTSLVGILTPSGNGIVQGAILRWDTNGTFLSATRITETSSSVGYNYIRGISKDSAGNIYIIGTMCSPTLEIRSQTGTLLTTLTRTSTSFADAYIVEYNTDLTAVVWAKNLTIGSSPYHTGFHSISVDTSQNVVTVIGTTTADQVYDTTGLILTKRQIGKFLIPFVIRYDTNGTVLSAQEIITTPTEGGAFSSAVDGTGNAIVSMSMYDTWMVRYVATPNPPAFNSVGISTDGRTIAATVNGGQIYVTRDAGKTWTARDSSREWYAIAVSAFGNVMAAIVSGVSPGQIYTSTDFGSNWTARDSSRDWRGIAMSDSGLYMIAVVNAGQIYVSSNYGVTWTARETNRVWSACSVGANSANGYLLYAATVNGGQIYTSTNGSSWTARDVSRNWSSIAIIPHSSSTFGSLVPVGVATVNGGQIYTGSGNGLSTWTARDTTRNWVSCAISWSGTNMVAGVSGDRLYVSENTGVTWNPKGEFGYFNGVAMNSTGSKIAAVQGSYPVLITNY